MNTFDRLPICRSLGPSQIQAPDAHPVGSVFFATFFKTEKIAFIFISIYCILNFFQQVSDFRRERNKRKKICSSRVA